MKYSIRGLIKKCALNECIGYGYDGVEYRSVTPCDIVNGYVDANEVKEFTNFCSYKFSRRVNKKLRRMYRMWRMRKLPVNPENDLPF